MSFVTLFRPLRVVPNTLDPSLDGLDWGAMSMMFSGCLSPASTPSSLVSVMAPPCPLTCHPSMTSLPGPSTKYDPRTFSTTGEEHVDTAYSNLVGPNDTADQWGDKGGKKARMETLNAWIGTGRRKSSRRMHRRVNEDDDAVLSKDTDEHRLGVGPSTPLKTLKRFARSDDSSDSSEEGGSDDHARTAWKLFGVGELEDACTMWSSPLSQSQSQVRPEAVVDIGTLPTPTSSPLLRERRLGESNKGKERAIECASQSGLPLAMPVNHSLRRVPTEIVLPPVTPDPSRLTSFVSACASPFVSFDDTRFSGLPFGEQEKEAVGSGSQPFACLDNVVLSDPLQEFVPSHPPMQYQSKSQPILRLHERSVSITQNVGYVRTMADVENVGEIPPPKRQRIDRGDSEVKLGKKDDVPELAGGEPVQVENTHLMPCGRDETCELSSTGLTRMPTVPSVVSRDDDEASLPPTSSALEVEGVLGTLPRSSPAPTVAVAVTATTTISFPVRKRVKDRANYAGKTASLSPRTSITQLRQGLAPCSTSAIVGVPALAVERTSTVIRAERLSAETSAVTLNASTYTDDAPVSPRTAARRAERAERRRITEKLRLARPDLVERAQTSRRGNRGRGLERATTSGQAVASTSTTVFTSTSASASAMDMRGQEVIAGNGMNVTEEDIKMDWDKSRRLAERVREAVKRGESPNEVLPRLRCLERWYAELVGQTLQ
ncbi:hypothetical protein J3R82DRAFT_9244 [Butyriboletus roseoflavus]|nr:hypothetical protein J3R82DRAFT_9244 [Butyriboletus roseoflavus]